MSLSKPLSVPGTRQALAEACGGALRAAAADLSDPRLTPCPGLGSSRLRELTRWLEQRASLLEAAAGTLTPLERNLRPAVAAALVDRDSGEPGRPALVEAVCQAAHAVDATLAGYGIGRATIELPSFVRELGARFRRVDDERRDYLDRLALEPPA